MSGPPFFPDDRALLVVTDVASRLVRRGLLAPADAVTSGWRRARVLVFRDRPVVYQLPPRGRALTLPATLPTFQPSSCPPS